MRLSKIFLGAILVFDITNKKSFQAINNWLEDIRNYGPESIQIVIVGNKLDKSYQRDVSFEEANIFCQKNNLKYFEVSALNGKNVTDIFENLSKLIIKIESDKEKRKMNNSSSKIKIDNKSLNNKTNKSISLDKTTEMNFDEDYQMEKKSKCC